MTKAVPPEGGELLLTVHEEPVSQQSSRANKDRFAQLISEQVAGCGYLLSGDVKVWIEWNVHEQDRYESDIKADVDNILKPLLDALCGPKGILIDDCQVQEVCCNWVDSYDRTPRVDIKVRYFHDEFITKNGLCFVHFGKGRCLPINLRIPPEDTLSLVEHLHERMERREQSLERGDDYYQARYWMPIQRIFHRSRVNRFPVVEFDELLDRLRREIEEGEGDDEVGSSRSGLGAQ
jgi:Holliday junction resolvase RusA-like endonuclease